MVHSDPSVRDESQALLTPVQGSAVVLLVSPGTDTHPRTHTHAPRSWAGKNTALPAAARSTLLCGGEHVPHCNHCNQVPSSLRKVFQRLSLLLTVRYRQFSRMQVFEAWGHPP